ncbi:phage NrS-1 polymerase family protein [Paenibacillus woosongensis]|uniref:NrS-1 polymerase-like HBD domain-containing protein n=1 Tax=Paenibacillus woosongensis TaxID=307580 RepID=A0ABQ4MXD4_9BACL|nr:DUF3987 domain-containing protein [Paenibacillus woosongensis]GIP60586.1 hypothetical protein J15TS10_44000 [Paenibacillus woosongensis]
MLFEKIPSELKNIPQWVLWKLEQRRTGAKPTKVPYSSTGQHASVNDPSTWATFEEVITAYWDNKAYSGIGFVLTKNQTDHSIVVIDIDGCVKNGRLDDEARDIISRFDSYTERSQSGEGIHIVLRGSKPGERSRTRNIEIYDELRFIVFTGDHVNGTPSHIEERQPELINLYNYLFPAQTPLIEVEPVKGPNLEDETVLRLAKKAKNGARFEMLYSGKWSAYNSQSEAEQALCNMLAFYTKNPEQIDRLFRDSGLMRDKWNRDDYRERTISKALEGVVVQYNNLSNSTKLNNNIPQPGEFDETEFDFIFNPRPEFDGKLGEAALYGLAGEIVRFIDPHTEADPAAVLINFLTMYGNMIGDSPHFVVSGGKHHMRLFAVLVGATFRGKKGTSLDPVLKLMNAADVEFNVRKKSGLSSGEGLIYSVRDQVIESRPVMEGKGKDKRPTGEYEDVIIDPGVEDKRLLVIESEFGSVLNVLRREGNTLSAIIRNAWDGSGELRTLTKNPMQASRSHISILGHITPEELRKLLTGNEIHNGFVNRFLWLYVQQSKSLPSGGEFHKLDVEPFVNRIKEACDYAMNGMPLDDNGGPLPMERDEAANQLWECIYEPLQRDATGIIGASTSRVIPYVMRLACIYALLDLSNIVRVEHLRAALALWDYCYKSVVFIFGEQELTNDPIISKILTRLKGQPEGLSLTDINDLFKGTVKSDELQSAVKKMQDNGLITVKTIPGRGRPKRLIELNQSSEIA